MMSAGRLVRSAFSFPLAHAASGVDACWIRRRRGLAPLVVALVRVPKRVCGCWHGMSLLFRPEVAEAQRQNWLGQVQLVRPLSLTVFTVGVLCLLALVIAFLFLGEYTRKARIGGVLVPDLGVIRLVPPVQGRVLERHVTEGQAVRAGEVMFVLALESSTLSTEVQARVHRSLEERKRSLEDAARHQAALAEGEQLSLQRRLDEMKREQTQIEAEAVLHRQRLALAQQSLERLESLEPRPVHLAGAGAEQERRSHRAAGPGPGAGTAERHAVTRPRGPRRRTARAAAAAEGAPGRDRTRPGSTVARGRGTGCRAPDRGACPAGRHGQRRAGRTGAERVAGVGAGQPDPGRSAASGPSVRAVGCRGLRPARPGGAASFRGLPVPEVRPPDRPCTAGVAHAAGRAGAGRPDAFRPNGRAGQCRADVPHHRGHGRSRSCAHSAARSRWWRACACRPTCCWSAGA